MKKQFTYLLSCVLVLFVMSSCVTTEKNGSKNDKPPTTTGQDDKDNEETENPSGVYKIGQRSTKIGSDMSMKVMSVKDSRCPTGTNCFTAGKAIIVFEVIKNGRSVEATLEAKGICEGDDGKCGNSTLAASQKIQLLNVYPYPAPGSTIKQEDYTAKVRIN